MDGWMVESMGEVGSVVSQWGIYNLCVGDEDRDGD